MFRHVTMLLGVLTVVVAAVIISGCQPSEEAPSKQKPDGTTSTQPGHAMDGSYEAALAELSPADRQLAEKQKVCPVSGEPLGSMGKPYKVIIDGSVVLLCCQGCESTLKKDPQKYLATLPE